MRRLRLPETCSSLLALCLAVGCATSAPPTVYEATIRRTAGGIPHVRATDLAGLGFGTLFAQAEDNLCILAEQFLTFGAERSRHLGTDAGNRESDLFYQLLIDRGDAAEPLPEDLEGLFEGAAAGYNHFLRESEGSERRDARCADAPWLREAQAIDLKRISRADYALAYMRPMLVAAAPPGPEESSAHPPTPRTDPVVLAAAVEAYLEVPQQGGSNGVAIGRDAAEGGGALLLANPHMPWNEPFQRFYPMHQTIPGVLDILGANLIGRPRVGFGQTEYLAWTSTVSTAKRLSFYRLVLDPEDPTAYVFDGESMPMKRHRVQIRALDESGAQTDVSHTFYETHFGALIVESPFFDWTREHAFAVRLLDAGWRGEISLLDQARARSVRELKAIHDRHQFLPVNLIAADHTGEVLYADPGPVPYLPDEVVDECAVLGGAALDGSRSACQWQSSDRAAAPGIFPPDEQPFLYRSDYVTNSNDSYWLANPKAPIAAHAKAFGSRETPRTLRTRSGLEMLARELEARGRVSLEGLRRLTLSNENHAGRLIRDDVVAFCEASPRIEVDGATRDLGEACRVLAAWDLRADLESRGALLFRQLLTVANEGAFTRELPASYAPAVPFDPADPVGTPLGLDGATKPLVLGHLARAVEILEDAGIPLDAPLGDWQGVTRQGERIALHGGPEFEGVFNKIESDFRGAEGYPEVDRWSSSWILAVALSPAGPRSFGILTYSLSDDPDSPHHADQTRLFSEKRWLALPFRAEDVEAAAIRVEHVRGGDR